MSKQTLFYKDSGSGATTFVLVHGFTCDHSDWQSQVDALRQRHRVIAVDLNGHGQSPQGEPEPAAMAVELANLIDSLKLTRPILVGHSMGTRVITHAATVTETAIDGLIMVDGSRGASTPEQLARVQQIRQGQDYEHYARNLFGQMFSPAIDPKTRDRIIQRAVDMDPQWAMTLHANVATYDFEQLPDTLSQLNTAMLVVQCTTRAEDGGRRILRQGDSATDYTDYLAGYFNNPHSRVQILPDSSHFPQFESPAPLNRLLCEFATEH